MMTRAACVPLSAVYRRLDEHIAESEPPYDIITGLSRLRQWMATEGLATQPTADRGLTRVSTASPRAIPRVVDAALLRSAGAEHWAMTQAGVVVESHTPGSSPTAAPSKHDASAMKAQARGGPVSRILLGGQLRR